MRKSKASLQRWRLLSRRSATPWAAFAPGMLAMLIWVVACDPPNRIRAGMPERDVVRIMGQPSRTVEDAAMFREELVGESNCVTGAQRILVFHVTARSRVRVVLDSKATVVCVVKTEDMMY